MLKELVDIWKYVNSIKSPVESYITIPWWDFYIVWLNFDGEKFFFDDYIKEWDKNDLIKMCYRTWKWRILSIMPNSYIDINKEWDVDWIWTILQILNNLSNELEIFRELYNKYKDLLINDVYWYETILWKLIRIPKKWKNNKFVTKLYTIKVSNNFAKSFWLDTLSNNEYIYLWEIEKIKEYFLLKNRWEWAIINKGFCHVCETFKNNLVNFPKSKWVWFPYKFYNLDKPWFAYDLNTNEWYKSLWVCLDCYEKVQSWFNYFKTELNKSVLWEYAYVFPTRYFWDSNSIFDIMKKYDKKNISVLEENIKENVEFNIWQMDSVQTIFSFMNEYESEKLSEKNYTKLNFIFWKIDSSNSDRLQVNYFIKDVLPSRVWKLYESNRFLLKWTIWDEIDKSYIKYITDLLGITNISVNLYKNLPELFLYPIYEKWRYVWDLKSFFKLKSENDTITNNEYYRFIDIYLHDWKYPINDMRSIIQKKLKNDYVKNYLKSKNSSLFFSIIECYIVYIYLSENNLLDIKQNKMENISFKSDNKYIKNLQNYYNASDTFDNWDKIYASLIWLYVRLLLQTQKKELKSIPFISRINFDTLDYDWLLKLLNETRAKFNKYANKKFNYYPELYRLILETSMSWLEKTLSRDEIVYYFSIGMEILVNVYFDREIIEEDDVTEDENSAEDTDVNW